MDQNTYIHLNTDTLLYTWGFYDIGLDIYYFFNRQRSMDLNFSMHLNKNAGLDTHRFSQCRSRI